MKPIKTDQSHGFLFEPRLSNLLNPNHELILFSHLVDWNELENDLMVYFPSTNGAPAKPIRLITGLLILQHFYGFKLLHDDHDDHDDDPVFKIIN